MCGGGCKGGFPHDFRQRAGAPSVLHGQGGVGATDLLQAPTEVFELDFRLPMSEVAQQVTIPAMGLLNRSIRSISCLSSRPRWPAGMSTMAVGSPAYQSCANHVD